MPNRDIIEAADVREIVQRNLQDLLRHPYFAACESASLPPEKVLKIVEQLYCMSTFFVRLLARRLARFPSDTSPALVQASRTHLIEEIDHPEMFIRFLRENGLSDDQISNIAPTCFLKGIFGYLIATIEYEREQVVTVALFQVMESSAFHFFRATLALLNGLGLAAAPIAEHVEHDQAHSEVGLIDGMVFDAATARDIERVTNDLFRLMRCILDDWMAAF